MLQQIDVKDGELATCSWTFWQLFTESDEAVSAMQIQKQI